MNQQTIKHWLLLGACGVCLLPGCASSGSWLEPIGPVYSASNPGPARVTTVAPCSICASPAPARPVSVTPVVAVAQYSSGSPFASVQRPVSLPQNAVANASASANQPAPSADEGPAATLAFVPKEGPEPTMAMSSPAARLGFEPPLPPGELLPPLGAATAPAITATAPAITAEPPAHFPRAEPGPERKSFVDPTAAPCFGHAADYSWITGQVEYCHITKEWRLRYTSVDEMDQYGGRVVLVENHHVSLLQDGQYVKVHGHLVNQDAVANGPICYRIESFETVQKPNLEEGTAELP
jgi:hypothetical protein